METANLELLARVDRYVQDLFTPEDPLLSQALKDSEAAGLPPINVSPNEGKLLYLLAKISRANRILEIGTLGAYSTIWLARALPSHGKLITIEINPKHAAVAQKNLERAGLNTAVEIRVGPASEILKGMIEAGEPSFDLVFVDAYKPSYIDYLDSALHLAHSGTVILADNVLRHGSVLDEASQDENAAAIRDFNQIISSHPCLESIILPIFRDKLDGLSISIVK